ncbi:metal-dependent hydrolase [Paracoccus sp. S4493]|uniref:MYG1 family protein n=1 Tax=Paracoccus sp. S4493 TaxID=579490 RepID=UPI0005F9E51B|nr:MYG1 family protein [Paracoccus sp. S4493]KJZ31597.1 metal-dependent hydrolase [Paracoccus sp. S4493]
MTVTHLVTHSGGFHADEVLSTVILTRLHPQARIMRTRDADWITPAEGRIIYDVGRDFDAARMIFDHHQKSPPLRDEGQPYSSFGLIWRQFGRDYLAALQVPEADLGAIHAAIDVDLVLPIDLVDNGALSPTGPLADLSLPMLLESLKPVFDDRSPDADDRAFGGAVAIARAFVEAAVARKAAKYRAEAVVMAAIAAAGDGRVLELPMGMPFRSAITAAGADHLLFVIHPRDTDWALTGIRRDADGFALRADLPAAWAGLTDCAFEAASGVPGARFCHNARFIAVAADRDAALRLADLAVAASDV